MREMTETLPSPGICSHRFLTIPPPDGVLIADDAVSNCPLRRREDDSQFAGAGCFDGITVHRRCRSDHEVTIIDLDVGILKNLDRVSIGQRVLLSLPWDSYVIAPGVAYAANRFQVLNQTYPPFVPTDGVTSDGPVIIADVPRLAADSNYRMELAANAMTTPWVGVFDPRSSTGVLMHFPVYGAWALSGITITTRPGEPIELGLQLPVLRTTRYGHCAWVSAEHRGSPLRQGMRLHANLRLEVVAATQTAEFVSCLARRAFETRDTTQFADDITLSAAAELVETKLDACNWRELHGFYATEIDQSARFPLQSGWVGGGVTMLAMLLSPHRVRQQRATRMLDYLCTAAAPSGYFHGLWRKGRWQSFDAKRPGCRAFAFVRRPIELCRDILKAVDVIESRRERVEARWIRAAEGCLEAMTRTIREFGHLGYTVDPLTGNVLWGDSTCGAFAIEPLTRAFVRFGRSAYLDAAETVARRCCESYLTHGFTCGGVGDALMAPDSESAYALLSGLVHLHNASADREYLRLAVQAADLFQTWVLLYDAQLPPRSPLGSIGTHPRGAVVANVQNQHAAPGICTASGNALKALSEGTGDRRFEDLLREIMNCQPQMVVRPGKTQSVWRKCHVGTVSERLMTMDGMLAVGETDEGSTWCEIATLLAAREVADRMVSAG